MCSLIAWFLEFISTAEATYGSMWGFVIVLVAEVIGVFLLLGFALSMLRLCLWLSENSKRMLVYFPTLIKTMLTKAREENKFIIKGGPYRSSTIHDTSTSTLVDQLESMKWSCDFSNKRDKAEWIIFNKNFRITYRASWIDFYGCYGCVTLSSQRSTKNYALSWETDWQTVFIDKVETKRLKRLVKRVHRQSYEADKQHIKEAKEKSEEDQFKQAMRIRKEAMELALNSQDKTGEKI